MPIIKDINNKISQRRHMEDDTLVLKAREILDLLISMSLIEHSILSPGPNCDPFGTPLECKSPSLPTPMSTNIPEQESGIIKVRNYILELPVKISRLKNESIN